MRIATARKRLQEFRAQAQNLGWAEGDELFARAEHGLYDKTDKLMGKSRDSKKLRGMIVTAVEATIKFYAQFLEVETKHQQSRGPAIRAYTQMVDTEQLFCEEFDGTRSSVGATQQIANHLKEYANTGAYQDEQEHLTQDAYQLESYSNQADAASRKIDETDRAFAEAQDMAQEQLDKMFWGINTLIDTDIDLLFAANTSSLN